MKCTGSYILMLLHLAVCVKAQFLEVQPENINALAEGLSQVLDFKFINCSLSANDTRELRDVRLQLNQGKATSLLL